MEIFKLVGSILIDSSEAEKSISSTGEKAEGLGSKLKSGLATAVKWGAGIAAGAVAAGTAVVKMAQDTANSLDVVDKGSIRMGIAAESYQELAYAADLSGVSMTTLERAAKSLVDTDMSFDEALDSLMAIEDETERTQAAVEMFGEKVAYDMQPLLQAGADGLNEMKQEANDLGLVMSQETVSAGAQLNDMFSKVQQSTAALKNDLMADLIPAVNEILSWVLTNMPLIRNTIKTVVDAVWPIVKRVIDLIMDALPPIMNLIKKVLDFIMPYVTKVFDALSSGVNAIISLLQGDIKGFADGITDMFKNLASAFFNIGKSIFSKMWDGMKSIWSGIQSWAQSKIDWLKNAWKNAVSAVKSLGTGDTAVPNGSHASGLSYVPYDGYVATLHRGETVLSQGESQSMVADIVNALAGVGGVGSGPITLQVNLDGTKIAEAVYDPLNKIKDRRGVAYGF